MRQYDLIRSSTGFTLLEMLIAIAIFSIGALAMAQVFATNITLNTQSERRTEAIEAAQQYLDSLRVEDPSTWLAEGAGDAQEITVNGHHYTIEPTFCARDSYCTSRNIRQLSLVVKKNGQPYYEIETVFTQLK